MASSERTPLLWDYNDGQIAQYEGRREHRHLPQATTRDLGDDVHAQFCALVGCRPSNAPPDYEYRVNNKSIYGRATHLLRTQNRTYMLSATISNTLLLVQVVLGAALTGLGASNSPGWVITLFGATNTVIAGVVAYLKSRGQPMRARVFRDDIERVVNEIENSEIMWLGISQNVHGYDDIDTDGDVTVRSEVARLTRLYDRAVQSNTMNNPDMYMAGQSDNNNRAGLRNYRGTGPQMTNAAMPAALPPVEGGIVAVGNSGDTAATAPNPSVPVADPDQSPASAPPKPKEEPKKDDTTDTGKPTSSTSESKQPEGKDTDTAGGSDEASSSQPSAPTPAVSASATQQVTEDPDAAPASKASFHKKTKSGETPTKVSGGDDDE